MNFWKQAIGLYLVVAQCLIGWPLVTLALLVTQPVARADEQPAAEEQPIGTITYPSNVTPTQGEDTGLVTAQTSVPPEPTDVDLTMARIFREPLVPMSGDPITGENGALAAALKAYASRSDFDDVSALDGFLSAYPNSRWLVSLQTSLGVIRKNTGYFTEAMQRFQQAWDAGKTEQSIAGRAVADHAIGELADLNARFGRFGRMKEIFDETKDRDITGLAHTQLTEAREGYWMMTKKPAEGFRCGPYAINAILCAGKTYVANDRVSREPSTQKGTNLSQLHKLAQDVNLSLVPALKDSSGQWSVPMVIHWKVGHFAAITKKEGDRYLVKDPTFGSEIWVTAKALDQEGSGYGLVPTTNGALPTGWTAISDEQAANIWGKGGANNRADPPAQNTTDCKRMTVYAIEKMRGTLQLSDQPVGYTPPFGPAIETLVRYADLSTAPVVPLASFGSYWMWNWGSYIEVDAGGSVTLRSGLGGSEVYEQSGFDPILHQYQRSLSTGAVMHKINVGRYEQLMPDGSIQAFAQVDGTSGRILLKEVIDPYGNKVILNYDGNMRLTSIVDGLAHSTTVSYKSNTAGNAGFYKVYQITDPFSRTAEFTYDPSLIRLIKIRDVIGIESSFTYGDDGFITKLTTPYGDTNFVKYVPGDPTDGGLAQGVTAILPDGSKEALESYIGHEKTTYYWNRKAMALAPGNRDMAEQTNWLLSPEGQLMMDVPAWTKRPLEGTVTYTYPAETTTVSPDPDDHGALHSHVGSIRYPSTVARTVNGQLQQYQYEYNELGKVTKSIDPIGRTFEYLYSVDGVDLHEIRQRRTGANDLLGQYTYNTVHQPLTYIDPSGRKTIYTYNTRGQLLTKTNPKGGVISYTYDTNGYLTQVDGPLSGNNDRIELTYDAVGRVQTVKSVQGPTSADQRLLTYSYDALDRTTQVLYPDGTTDQTIYSRLDPLRSKDRLGRWTRTTYNSLRQLIGVRDPAGRNTAYEWCRCGALQGLTDPLGNVTKWTYDIDGRMTKKTYADGSHQDYTYESDISRLASATDPAGNTTSYTYNIDNTKATTSYSAASGFQSVPTVNFEWSPDYERLTKVSDGTDHQYQYVPYSSSPYGTPQNGVGQLQQVQDGTVAINYTYDELGRLVDRQIPDSGNDATWSYDAAGRVSSWTNALGTSTPTYVNAAYGVNRLASVSYPDGHVTNYQWENATGDYRLKEIQNLDSTGAALSKFDYVTDAGNRINQWTQQVGSATPTRYDYTYDQVDQLVGAALKDTGTNSLIKSYGYGYDAMGNRTSQQEDAVIRSASFNNLNQIVSGSGGGMTKFKGTLNEPGNVTVGGQGAQMAGGTNFSANVSLSVGTNSIPIIAKDASNNIRTNSYQVVVPSGSSKTYTFDGNGNMLSDGAKTYTWDAKNRLVKIVYPDGTSSAFAYDAFDRRVQIVEKNSFSIITSAKMFVWDGLEIAEQRGTGNSVTMMFFPEGVENIADGTINFKTKDHLGSTREILQGGSLVSRYGYDPYGVLDIISGNGSDMLYAGYYFHMQSRLYLAPYRAYDSGLGRWNSRDPIGEAGGDNLYGYVANNPISFTDPLGLFLWPWQSPTPVKGGNYADRQRARDALRNVRRTQRGQELLKQIREEGQPRTVNLTDNNTAKGNCPGPNMYVDPDFSPEILTTDGFQKAQLDEIIGHELGHNVTGTGDTGPNQMDNINQNENPMRQEWGRPERTRYAPRGPNE